MAFPVRACALVGRFTDPQVAETLNVLVPHLVSREVTVLVGTDTPLPAHPPGHIERIASDEVGRRADLVIAVGGDGTLLYAAALVARQGVPLLGINRGRVGFLTDVMPEQLVSKVDAALQGALVKDERPLIAARLEGAGGTAETLALNDVVVQRLATGRMVDVEAHVDGRYVNTYAGDGVVVASATGSTAYALSCGGPIVEPHLDVFVVAPICPHTLSNRPIVISARATIQIQLIDLHDMRAQLVCDGTVLMQMSPGERLSIRQATERVTLLHPPSHDYFALLRSKLHWGHGSHDHTR
jgi:NAD+ kinase